MEHKTAIPGIYKVGDGILINKDNDALKAYKARKEKDKQIEVVQTEVAEMKKDLCEIKELLMDILRRK